MKLLLFEHMCGGLLASEAALAPRSLLRQGASMLRAVADDFLDAGVEVFTLLHEHAPIEPDGLNVTEVRADADIISLFDDVLNEVDAALVIAPESADTLARWTDRVVDAGVHLLGCSRSGIDLCGDKQRLADHFAAVNIPTPPTRIYHGPDDVTCFPAVIKPRHGVGCDHTFVCRGPKDLAMLPEAEDWIVQSFVAGLDVSCSLIVHGTTIRPLPPGEQLIGGDGQMDYGGGCLPLTGDLADRARRLAQDAAGWAPGLKGFVGVDMILGQSPADDCVIEINPRITLSYVALRKICRPSLARALIDSEVSLEFTLDRICFDAAGSLLPESSR